MPTSRPAPAREAPATVVAPEPGAETRLAPRTRVLLHNDDVTPMDFVVHVLVTVFAKPTPDATRIMREVHLRGLALVDVLPYEQAEWKVQKAVSLARTRKYPLAFSLEPE